MMDGKIEAELKKARFSRVNICEFGSGWEKARYPEDGGGYDARKVLQFIVYDLDRGGIYCRLFVGSAMALTYCKASDWPGIDEMIRRVNERMVALACWPVEAATPPPKRECLFCKRNRVA